MSLTKPILQVVVVPMGGRKSPVVRYLFNKGGKVNAIYFVADGKNAGKWFVVKRNGQSPLEKGKKKKKKGGFSFGGKERPYNLIL